MLLGLMMVVLHGAPESIAGVPYRAVTLDPTEHRRFKVPGLETVTGASGRCVEEGLDLEEQQTFWLEASCSGVRTTLVWLKDGTRLHVMACAEPESRDPQLVKTRQKVQAEVKALKSVTACVRNGHVELWGWVTTDADLKKMTALEKKFGFDTLKSNVELLPAE
jgi:hypothetical protein